MQVRLFVAFIFLSLVRCVYFLNADRASPPPPPDSQPYSDPDFGANHGRYHLPADQQVQVQLLVSVTLYVLLTTLDRSPLES